MLVSTRKLSPFMFAFLVLLYISFCRLLLLNACRFRARIRNTFLNVLCLDTKINRRKTYLGVKKRKREREKAIDTSEESTRV